MENFLILKKLHSDNMEFQLQQMYNCETVGKDVCIIGMVTGRNYIPNDSVLISYTLGHFKLRFRPCKSQQIPSR